jgi:hypothetical protein
MRKQKSSIEQNKKEALFAKMKKETFKKFDKATTVDQKVDAIMGLFDEARDNELLWCQNQK